MGRLEYDDAGFAYFGLGLGLFFLVPYTLSFVWSAVNVLTGRSASALGDLKPRTALEREKLQKVARDAGPKTLFTQGWLVRAGVLVLMWMFMAMLFSQTGEGSDVLQFDPWEILDIPEGTPQKKIRSKYRKLSLQFHPDRNVNKDPGERAKAAMVFERIQKAHEILTNEDAFKLFQETGSPDGSRNMEVSIGLPKFLMEKRNHNLVLVVYLLILVVVTPISVGSWYMNSKRYGDKLILNDTYNIFIYLLEKGLPLKYLPEVLALSAEFRDLPPRSEAENKLIESLRESMKKDGVMCADHHRKVDEGRMMKRWPACDRANVLIHAYLNRRTAELTPGLQEDLDFILKKSKMLVEAMSDAVVHSRHMRSIQNIIEFEQYMTQGLWLGASALEQLPFVSAEVAAKAGAGKGALKDMATFLGEGHKEGLDKLSKELTAEQVQDVEVAAKLFPQVELKVTIGVIAHQHRDGTLDFEEKACEGDIMTAFVELHRHHNIGPVHAPFLPFLKEEEWVVLFCKAGESAVLSQVKLSGKKHVMREKIQFPSKGFIKPGFHEFDFYLMSTSYVGMDQKVTDKVRLYPEGTVKPLELHQEDIDLDNEPTLFEEAFGKVEQEEDSDFADSDDEKAAKDQPKLTQRKGAGAAKGSDLVADEDDDVTDAGAEEAPAEGKKTK